MHIDIERIIHSLKTVIACIIALLLAKLIGLSADQWIVITVIVVMCAQIYVGSVMQKAYLRFLGTFIGCVLASITLMAFGATNLAIISTIALSSFIFSYLATGQESLSYAGTLGAVTTAIIMLGQKPTILFAVERFLEISVGILIATLISQYILPIHARTHLRRTQADTLEQLRNFYIAAMVSHADNMQTNYQDLDESIVQLIMRQRQLAKESARERLGEKFDTEHFTMTLYCEREILRTITFMHNAFKHIKNAETSLAHLPALQNFNSIIQQSLNTFIKVIKSSNGTKEHIHLPDLNTLRNAVKNQMIALSSEQLIYVDGFLFSAEVLTNALAKLAELYGILVYQCGFSKLNTPEL